MAKTKKNTVNKGVLASPVSRVIVIIVAVCAIAALSIAAYTLLSRSNADAAGASTCGNGYASSGSDSGKFATLKGFYNKNTKKFCYLLIATGKASGVKKPMSVSSGASDSGNYLYYAGPIYSTSSGAKGSMTFENKSYSFYIAPSPEGKQSTPTQSTQQSSPVKQPIKTQPSPIRPTR